MCGLFFICFSNCHLSVSKGAFVFGQVDASRTLDFGHWRRASIAKHALHDWRASPAQGAAFQFLGSSQSDPGPSPPRPHGAPASPGGCRSAPFKKTFSAGHKCLAPQTFLLSGEGVGLPSRWGPPAWARTPQVPICSNVEMVGPAASPSAQVFATRAGACLLRTLRDGGFLPQEQRGRSLG